MQAEEIIQKTLNIYSGDKNQIAKYLGEYIAADSKYESLCQKLFNRLDVPILARSGISEANLERLRSNLSIDKQTIFDSSDYYQFVLNEDICQVDDWDFIEHIEAGKIIRLCRLFVNNCLPVYHLHIQLIGSNIDRHSLNYEDYSTDLKTVNTIKKISDNSDFVQCSNKILNNRYARLKTDLVEYNASIYECLFSDFHLLFNNLSSIIILL